MGFRVVPAQAARSQGHRIITGIFIAGIPIYSGFRAVAPPPLRPSGSSHMLHFTSNMLSDARVRSFSSLLDASDDFPVVGGAVNRGRKRGDCSIALIVLSLLLAVGVCLGLVLPASNELHGPYRRISVIIGWTYFCR